jgi:hypothetical protein
MAHLRLPRFALLVLVAAASVAGCPPDGTVGDYALCAGPGCVNASDCPALIPESGDACTFSGNCHYCLAGDTTAEGYTCDGAEFTAQGTFECE